MNKKVYEAVMKRSKGHCENCGRYTHLSLHHAVSGRGKRKERETEESCFALCWECHQSDQGVHGKNGHKLDLKLKLIVQERYKAKGYTEDEIRSLMGGRIYIEEVA